MPTRFPERRPQTGLNSWHKAGISLGLAVFILGGALFASGGRPLPQDKPAPSIKTGIAPLDAKR
jgi:hypothetical protein